MRNHSELRHQMFAKIEDWQQSGLSQKAFCEHHRIGYHRFYYWLTAYRKTPGITTRFLNMSMTSCNSGLMKKSEYVRLRNENNAITSFAYDYFLKDHLGNPPRRTSSRMVLTEEQKQDVCPMVSLELPKVDIEENYFDIQPGNIVHKSTATGIPDYQNNNGISNKVYTGDAEIGKAFEIEHTLCSLCLPVIFVVKKIRNDKTHA